MELFDYVESLKRENYILKMPMEQLQATLLSNPESEYEIKVGSINNIIFTKKGDTNLINIKCIKNYYNIDIDGSSIDDLQCVDIKNKYVGGMSHSDCVDQNCAECHLRAIEDFFDDKITRK